MSFHLLTSSFINNHFSLITYKVWWWGLGLELLTQTNTIIIHNYKVFKVCRGGTLHPPPLNNNTVLGVHVFSQSPSPYDSSFVASIFLFWAPSTFPTFLQATNFSKPIVSCQNFKIQFKSWTMDPFCNTKEFDLWNIF